MKYLTLFVIFFASILQSANAVEALSTTIKGFKLDQRTRKVVSREDVANHSNNNNNNIDLRQWDEDEYEAIMSTMSGSKGGTYLRHQQHRQTQHQKEKNPYYSSSSSSGTKYVTKTQNWQKFTLGFFAVLFFALLFYVVSLKNELATLNQYIPLGYKLFPDYVDEEEERVTSGMQELCGSTIAASKEGC